MPSLLSVVSDFLQKRKSMKPSIVALLAEERDRIVVSEFCRRGSWEVSFANTCSEVPGLMDRIKAHIVFVDRDLAGPDWRVALSSFASSSSSGPCIILVTRVVDLYLWNEVARNGGYEVLPKPLREDDVSKAVRLAWSYWSTTKTPALPNPVAKR